jgi:AraC-like DNA-binding protein
MNLDSNYLLNSIGSYNFNMPNDTAQPTIFEGLSLRSSSLISSVFEFIEKNFQDSISLREVAEAVGRSPAYLTDLVRRETGKTVLGWIIERRMAEARRFLLETDRTIEQISEAVGYFDRRHFSRQFLRFHNTTPQVWRKKNQSQKTPFWQNLDSEKATSKNFVSHKATTVTDVEVQRLQACVQEIAAILNQKTSTDEVLILEDDNASIAKTDNGFIQITLLSASS